MSGYLIVIGMLVLALVAVLIAIVADHDPEIALKQPISALSDTDTAPIEFAAIDETLPQTSHQI